MSFARQWRRFRALDQTWGQTPGVREAWHQGRRWYQVWVLRIDDPRVDARRDALAAALAPYIEPFSTRSPHVTAWVAGWNAPTRHPAAGTPVAVQVGTANAFASCPFLEVRAPALRALRGGFGGPEDRWGGYLPHLTVGRFDACHPTGPVVDTLRAFRRLPPLRSEAALVPAWVDAFREDGELSFGQPS